MISQPTIVTLLTDFGLSDTYVGVMKGVLLAMAPHVRIVDLTHVVPPQAVLEGAFLLETAWRYFPAGTVHVVVVDPGVGGQRRRLVIRAQGHVFIGPDNGVLSSALPDELRGFRGASEAYKTRHVRLPGDIEAVNIDAKRFGEPSSTFEGRDVFVPGAAALANGIVLSTLGDKTDVINAYSAFRAPAHDQFLLDGVVLRKDSFGNLITDIRAGDLPPTPAFIVGGRRLSLVRTYEAAAGLTAIAGSSGFVEIARPNGNAARALGLGTGDKVRVEG
jgi:S-adenosylmethionine hydrolase